MYSILYPTDFSEQSLKIAELAIGFARQCNATLHILHVNAIPMISTDMPADALDNLIKGQEEYSNKQMQQLITRFSQNATIVGEARTGILTETINEYAEEKNIDLIMMSTHGSHGVVEKFFVGTNAEKVVKRSSLPVFVIPENSVIIQAKRLLYATDLESDESKALSDLKKFASAMNATVSAIHVDKEGSLDIFSDEKQVKRMKDALGEDTRLHSIKTDKVREGLEEFAEAHGYDVICATRIDRGLIDNFFHSSLTTSLVYSSKLPLLILHN